jgi:hypothetical protein
MKDFLSTLRFYQQSSQQTDVDTLDLIYVIDHSTNEWKPLSLVGAPHGALLVQKANETYATSEIRFDRMSLKNWQSGPSHGNEESSLPTTIPELWIRHKQLTKELTEKIENVFDRIHSLYETTHSVDPTWPQDCQDYFKQWTTNLGSALPQDEEEETDKDEEEETDKDEDEETDKDEEVIPETKEVDTTVENTKQEPTQIKTEDLPNELFFQKKTTEEENHPLEDHPLEPVQAPSMIQTNQDNFLKTGLLDTLEEVDVTKEVDVKKADVVLHEIGEDDTLTQEAVNHEEVFVSENLTHDKHVVSAEVLETVFSTESNRERELLMKPQTEVPTSNILEDLSLDLSSAHLSKDDEIQTEIQTETELLMLEETSLVSPKTPPCSPHDAREEEKHEDMHEDAKEKKKEECVVQSDEGSDHLPQNTIEKSSTFSKRRDKRKKNQL